LFVISLFGIIFHEVFGTNNSGHFSQTKYVFHITTGHQPAFFHETKLFKEATALSYFDFALETTLCAALFTLFHAFLILSTTHSIAPTKLSTQPRTVSIHSLNFPLIFSRIVPNAFVNAVSIFCAIVFQISATFSQSHVNKAIQNSNHNFKASHNAVNIQTTESLIAVTFSVIHVHALVNFSAIQSSNGQNKSSVTFWIVSRVLFVKSTIPFHAHSRSHENIFIMISIVLNAHSRIQPITSSQALNIFQTASRKTFNISITVSPFSFRHAWNFSIRGFTISEILSTTSCVFSLIHQKFVAHATHNAVTHAIIRPIGQLNIVNAVINHGKAKANHETTAINHATAVTTVIIVAVNFGFFSIQLTTFSIIGVTAFNNLSTTGINAFQIVFFIFCRCAFTLANFSCIVS
jgi:hypothetical protein